MKKLSPQVVGRCFNNMALTQKVVEWIAELIKSLAVDDTSTILTEPSAHEVPFETTAVLLKTEIMPINNV